MKITITLLLLLGSLALPAQTIIGQWKMVGMKSGKERSLIQIYERGGKYHGKVLEVYSTKEGDPDPVCDNCSDERKGKPVIGMDIITDLEYNGKNGEYRDGEILDPVSGDIYDCKAWLGKDGFLRVRGYVIFPRIGKTYILPKYIPE